MDHPILDLLEDIFPFLSLMTHISTTDNNDSVRNPCEMKIVKHLASNVKVHYMYILNVQSKYHHYYVGALQYILKRKHQWKCDLMGKYVERAKML